MADLYKIMNDIVKMKEKLYEEAKNYIATLTVEQKLELAKDPNTSVFDLEVLGEDPNAEIRIEVAKHPKMPYVEGGELEKRLANDQDPRVKIEIAKRSDISPTTVEQLANDQDPRVKIEIAKRSDLFPSTIDQLTNDQNPEVKLALIENPGIFRENLEQLTNDQNPEVRAAARKRLNEILRH